jgi:hypothetical protein
MKRNAKSPVRSDISFIVADPDCVIDDAHRRDALAARYKTFILLLSKNKLDFRIFASKVITYPGKALFSPILDWPEEPCRV